MEYRDNGAAASAIALGRFHAYALITDPDRRGRRGSVRGRACLLERGIFGNWRRRQGRVVDSRQRRYQRERRLEWRLRRGRHGRNEFERIGRSAFPGAVPEPARRRAPGRGRAVAPPAPAGAREPPLDHPRRAAEAAVEEAAVAAAQQPALPARAGAGAAPGKAAGEEDPAVQLAAAAMQPAAVVPPAAPASAARRRTNSGPPMGWASWNSFAAKINYNVIKAQADAMVSSGLKAAGYQYVNIDEGWWQGTRDASGNITVDTAEWPGGMQAIADYIHGARSQGGYLHRRRQGRAAATTTRPDARRRPNSGAEGHYDQDFLQFSKWGFDFVKVDWCGGSQRESTRRPRIRASATPSRRPLHRPGVPWCFSVCEWGSNSPWDWAPAMSTMWRTSQDIIYYGNAADMKRVLTNFDSAQHPTAQSPGHYNDPDMLIVGMSGFTVAQNRTHMALWAISSAPLLAGNQLDTMNADTKGVLTNSEVIAIDQDPLAKQGTKVSDSNGLQVYSKVLSGTGRRAVLLLNRSSRRQPSPFASPTSAWERPCRCGTSGPPRIWATRPPATAPASLPTTPSSCSSPKAPLSNQLRERFPANDRQSDWPYLTKARSGSDPAFRSMSVCDLWLSRVRISLIRDSRAWGGRDQAPAFHDAPGGGIRAGGPSLRSRAGEPARRGLVRRALVLGTPAAPRLGRDRHRERRLARLDDPRRAGGAARADRGAAGGRSRRRELDRRSWGATSTSISSPTRATTWR